VRSRPDDRPDRTPSALEYLGRETTGGEVVERGALTREIGLNHQHGAAGREPARRVRTKAIEKRPTVPAGIPRARRAAGREAVAFAGYVGGVGQDQIESRGGDRCEQIALLDPHGHAIERGVQARVQHRAPGDVDRDDLAGAGQGGGHSEGPTPGENVEYGGAVGQTPLSHDLDQEVAVARGTQHAGKDHGSHGTHGLGIVTGGPHLDAEHLQATFAAPEPLTIGLEEEVMLLDPGTLDLAPVAPEVLVRLDGDPRFKGELPSSQIEILTEPAGTVAEAIAALAAGRADLAAACEGLALPAAAGVHPFAAAEGQLTDSERYARIRTEYGKIAHRQLVASLQVQVAVGDAGRTLDVYNQLREYLPELAALAANAPFHEGRDTGLASVRPKIAEMLPRQGLPPRISGWEELAAELRWGRTAGAVPEPRSWWWELRPNPAFGTLEIRVPDAQTTIADAAGVAACAHALIVWLSDRGGTDRGVPTWRIDENRWSAARHGVEGRMADLETGETAPTRDRLVWLLDEIATASNAADPMAGARRLVNRNGAIRQRELVEEHGVKGLAAWLAEHFLDGE
jgi:glutamate---cysteine ligase / carboxylate-amine ligase